jgi:hypothetical protein
MAVNMKGKDLISIADLSLEEVYEIFDVSKTLKEKLYVGEPHRLLEGKTMGMISQNLRQERVFHSKQGFTSSADTVCILTRMICSSAKAKMFTILQKYFLDI